MRESCTGISCACRATSRSKPATGEEALELAYARIPDLILLDMSLAGHRRLGSDGRAQAQRRRTKHIPIVALTAHALQSERQRTERAGCDGFLAKPCAPPDLLAEITRLLGSRRGSTRQRGRLTADHGESNQIEFGRTRSTGLVEVLDRILDKGLFVGGDIKISLAEVELLTIRIRLIVCSLDKAREIGLDWWMYDRHLSPGRAGTVERDQLEQRIAALERQLGARRRPPVRPASTRADRRSRAQRGSARGGAARSSTGCNFACVE